MKVIRVMFAALYSMLVVLFACCAAALMFFAIVELWKGMSPFTDMPSRARLNSVLESMGLLTVAVAAIELGQTVLEEEILRAAHMSTPTRVRRFLSRFMVVIVVSLSIEALITIFKLGHDDPARLPHASTIALGAAALLAAWGVFLKLNRSAEELEPEAMEKVKGEDNKLE
jgi:hypothetical protein